MQLENNVYVMNELTWKKWQDAIFEEASKREFPLPYLTFAAKLEVVVDNTLPDEVIEVYNRATWDDFMEEENHIDFDEEGEQ